MNAASLNAREALESSLSFMGQFLKNHWVLAVCYVVIGMLPAFIIGNQEAGDLEIGKRLLLGMIMIINIIPGLLLIYYSLREALLKLHPADVVANKSLGMAFLQIIGVNIISAIVGIPLFILFIVPGIWWSTKAAVSYAHLLSTNDGPIESIQKSHQLMNGRFWSCFGFLLTTSSIVILVMMIIGATLGFFLLMGGLLNALFHEGGAGFRKIVVIFRLMGPIFSLVSAVILYYIQVWLYVYLRSQENSIAVKV